MARGREPHEPVPGVSGNVEDAVQIDPYQSLQIVFRLSTMSRRALDEVEGNTKDPVARGRPQDSECDPKPQIGKRPEVDQFEYGMVPVHLGPSAPLPIVCRGHYGRPRVKTTLESLSSACQT